MKRWICMLLSLCLVFALFSGLTASAATGSWEPNSGTRHELCVELSQQALDYYTGNYTYEKLAALPGASSTATSYEACQDNALYDALHDLMADTHEVYPKYSGYSSNSLATYWGYTDAEEGEHGYLFFYTDVSSNDTDHSMNREHVWPKSRASFYQKNGGSDLHHLRPSIPSVNSAKSNYAFGNVVGVISGYSTARIDGADVIWYSGSNDLLEVRDNIKGDVARIMLYVWCRWEQPNLYSNVPAQYLPPMDSDDSESNGKRVFESLETLLAWMEMDPVDEWEMSRNDQTENIQGNRNVFIDYPELAFLIFGEEIPADMPSPSGSGICLHEDTALQNAAAATCTQNGYTGDLVCLDCGNILAAGQVIEALGHAETELRNVKEATCTAGGYTGDLWCLVCNSKIASGTYSYPLGHSFEQGVCIRCGMEEPVSCKHENTELRNVKEGSCTQDGYTGDTYCIDCGLKLAPGTKVFATGHSYEDGVCTQCGEKEEGSVTPPAKNPFVDVSETDYYYDAVLWAVEQEITNGTDATHFSPDAVCTRGQIVTFLWRGHGAPEPQSEENPFADVDESAYYYKAVLWAVEAGITTGLSDTQFGPEETCTRGQVATFLWRAQGEPAPLSSENPFSDVSESAYYYDAVLWAVEQEITKGTGEGSFSPDDSCTRGQIVTFLYRALA